MKIAIVDYGAGNVQSIEFALNRLGFSGNLTSDPAEIVAADKVIFPGVGEAASAMTKLRQSGLDKIIPMLKQPVLGICLGMQLMCNSTEERDTNGLGIFDVSVKRFPSKVKVPQVGWNTITGLKSELFDGIEENSYLYSVHSYCAPTCDLTISATTYGEMYSSALQKANFYGVQFHPEKSGDIGEKVLSNFLNIKS